MSSVDKTWIYLMELVMKRWGCHQLPERSFFICGYQFPMCARCTGVLVGYIVAALDFRRHIKSTLCILLGLPMLADWSIQYLNIKQSNNIRRFITGLLCGYGFIKLCIKIIYNVCNQVLELRE